MVRVIATKICTFPRRERAALACRSWIAALAFALSGAVALGGCENYWNVLL